MIIEAELKARVRNPERVRELLQRRAREEVSTYSDTYFDTAGRELTRDGRELRVRVVDHGDLHRSRIGDPFCVICNLPDDVRDELAARAGRSGQSLQEYLRTALIDLVARPLTSGLRGPAVHAAAPLCRTPPHQLSVRPACCQAPPAPTTCSPIRARADTMVV